MCVSVQITDIEATRHLHGDQYVGSAIWVSQESDPVQNKTHNCCNCYLGQSGESLSAKTQTGGSKNAVLGTKRRREAQVFRTEVRHSVLCALSWLVVTRGCNNACLSHGHNNVCLYLYHFVLLEYSTQSQIITTMNRIAGTFDSITDTST